MPDSYLHLEWPPSYQSRKARIVAVGGYPLAAGFNGQRCKPGVLREIACGIGFIAEIFKEHPMAVAGRDDSR